MDNQNTRGLNDDDRTGNNVTRGSQGYARRSHGNASRSRPTLQALDTAITQLQQRTTRFINQAAGFGRAINRIRQAVKAMTDMLLMRNRTLATTGRRNSYNTDQAYSNLHPETGSLQMREKTKVTFRP